MPPFSGSLCLSAALATNEWLDSILRVHALPLSSVLLYLWLRTKGDKVLINLTSPEIQAPLAFGFFVRSHTPLLRNFHATKAVTVSLTSPLDVGFFFFFFAVFSISSQTGEAS